MSSELATSVLMLLQHVSAFVLLLSKLGFSHAQLDEGILRRHAEVEARFADSPVQGVRKMSDDEGEKFFFEYWQFDQHTAGNSSSSGEIDSRSLDQQGQGEDQTGSSPAQFLARSHPFTPSFSGLVDPGLSLRSLFRRDFKCPTGTNACLSINRSDRCCGSGDTCEVIKDTGHGSVGCCPGGKRCSGSVESCQSGYTACSKALGGGCCIPGYECVEGGCKYLSRISIFEKMTTAEANLSRCLCLGHYGDD